MWGQSERVRPIGASWFGAALALDEEWMLVGSPNEDCPAPDFYTQCGATYFYERAETGWHLHQRFQPDDLTDYDLFGSSIALAFPYALAAAPRWDTTDPNNAGAVYLYRLDGSGAWRFERLLRAPDPGRLDQFGRSVALAADTTDAAATALVGTIEALGAAYAFDLGLLLPTEPAAPEPTGAAVQNLSVYPNPSVGAVRLSYELAKPSEVHVEIADTLGRVVWARRVGHQGAGAHTFGVDDLDLASGLYLVRVSGDASGTVSRFLYLGR